jgi:hypothetical protein
MQQNTKIKRRRVNAPLTLEQRALALDAQLAYLGRVNYCALWHGRSGLAIKQVAEIDLVISEFDRSLPEVVAAIDQMKTELLGLRARALSFEAGE